MWVSEGAETQARRIASMVRRARDWITPILGMTPPFSLHVFSPTDWAAVAGVPGLTYGLPHTSDEGDRLIVGAQPARLFTATARDYLAHADRRTGEVLVGAYGDDLDMASLRTGTGSRQSK